MAHNPGNGVQVKPAGPKETLEWLNAHAGQTIRISASDHSFSLVGRPRKVEELDACSTVVHQCEFEADGEGLSVALTLHDDTLAVHATGGESPSGAPTLSVSWSLPYSRVKLDIAKAPPPPRKKEAESPEPDHSPYELLHTRTD